MTLKASRCIECYDNSDQSGSTDLPFLDRNLLVWVQAPRVGRPVTQDSASDSDRFWLRWADGGAGRGALYLEEAITNPAMCLAMGNVEGDLEAVTITTHNPATVAESCDVSQILFQSEQ